MIKMLGNRKTKVMALLEYHQKNNKQLIKDVEYHQKTYIQWIKNQSDKRSL